jgi:excisionase family DNA binding protein
VDWKRQAQIHQTPRLAIRRAARNLGQRFIRHRHHKGKSMTPHNENSSECFISKAEVATRLGKTARTIEHWMQRGVIPYLKLGRGRRATVLFKWADIEAHLKSNFSSRSHHE